MTTPPPIPPRPTSSATFSNPNQVWGAANPTRPTSVADSVRSVNSSVRRARALEAAEEAERVRREEFERNEARIKQEMEEHLEAEDQASLARGGQGEAGVVPPPPGEDGETVVLQRQLSELEERGTTLRRILLSRQTPTTTPLLVHTVQPSSDYADIVFKKVSAPKAWTGDFNHRRREAWIKTAQGYLASIGISPSLELFEAKQPGVFYHIRALFSSETKVNALSPQDWFDGIQRRTPFRTVQSVFDAMRRHWVEEGAAEAAFSKYRKASQGSLKVRDFGALVEVLANDIFDRQVTDDDKKATFLEGLVPSARNFVRQVQATQSATFGSETVQDFAGLVQLASKFDTMEGRSSSSSASPAPFSANSSSRRPAQAGATDPFSSKATSSKPAADSAFPKSWVELAVTWQERFPLKDKASWYKKDAKELSSVVRCYNCACTGLHYSSACPNPCQDPRSVTIAALSA